MIKAKFGECTECANGKEVLLYRRNPPQCQHHYQKQKAEIYKERADKKPQKARKQIKQFSKKKLNQLAEYRPKRDKYLKEHPICEVKGCGRSTTNLHHKAGREGKLLIMVEYFMACCDICHPKKIHENPEWARENGYILTVNL